MKILHVTHGFFPEGAGGVESYLRDVLREQRHGQGHDVVLVTGSCVPWPEVGYEELELEGLRAYRLHRDDLYFDLHAKLWHPGISRLWREILERERPEVVHVHQWIRLTCDLVEIAEEIGIPTVVTLHDLYTSCPRCFRVRPDEEHCTRVLSVASCRDCVPRFGHESEREIAMGIEVFRDAYASEIDRARGLLVASEATRELLAEGGGLPRERIEVLSLAYQPRFPGRAPTAPPVDGPFRFGYWGNLTARKGAPVLLRAFRELCQSPRGRAVELHLFGRVDTEALDAELRGLADGLPVTFHGRFEYDDLAAAGLHMAVFPMVCFETYGFVLDEAFELGIPALVTDLGAIPGRAGAAGLRVPPRDPGAMAVAMRRAVDEEGLYESLRAAVGPVATSLVEHVGRVQAVYEKSIAAGPRPLGQVSPRSRLVEFLHLQRETAQVRLIPDGGPR